MLWLVAVIAICGLAVGGLAAGPKFPEDYVRRDAAYKMAIAGNGEDPVLHHLPYKVEPAADMINLKPDLWGVDRYSKKRLCQLLPEPKAALTSLLADVNAHPLADGRKLFAYSCFRSVKDQVAVFCEEPAKHLGWCRDPGDRAKSSAPSGYSEHATGYTLDFTTCRTVGPKNTPADCGKLTEDFASTSAGQVLATRARDFGFELSFPCSEFATIDGKQRCNKTRQGVTYEPWHWRWVGTNENFTDAAKAARKTFARARKCFKADPDIAPISDAAETAQPISCPAPLGE